MRRVIMWLLIALCTFTLGMGATLLWIESRRPVVQSLGAPPCIRPPFYESISTPCVGTDFSALADIPNPSFCELVNNADFYNGKIVRVSARYGGNIHGVQLFNTSCSRRDTQTYVFFHPAMAEDMLQDFNRVRGAGSLNWWIPLDITVIGKFNKVTPSESSDAIVAIAPLQFEIMRIEKVSKVD
ncbi:MAG: hypothetical protein ABR577_17225 [Pyrinomonadaceae bacterium]